MNNPLPPGEQEQQAHSILMGMKLLSNQTAPEFTVSDVTGNVVDLNNYRDQKLALLFYRYAGCPFCQLHFHQFLGQYPRYAEKGLKVIAFFQSPRDSIVKYLPYANATFPIVSDPSKTIYHKYGVESSVMGSIRSLKSLPVFISTMLPSQGKIDGDPLLMPAGFLIDGDRTVKVAHYGTSFSDQISLKDIHEFLYKD